MSLGSHNHPAVSLAPPRLYFTGLKTPGALSSIRNARSVRKRSCLAEKRRTRLPYLRAGNRVHFLRVLTRGILSVRHGVADMQASCLAWTVATGLPTC